MKLLLDCLEGKKTQRASFWFMRQAGRYLPEYREIRASLNGFLDLCYNPEKATEVTLQPIRRFDMDAAIIFSDILVIPHSFGLKLDYVEKEGPLLETVSEEKDLLKLDAAHFEKKLAPVYETLSKTRSLLPKEKTLIGFAGAPWTLACYMIDGRGKKGFEATRKKLFSDPKFFDRLMEILERSIVEHLSLQIQAGAEVVQLFDSWAGLLPATHIQKYVIDSHNRITDSLKKKHPETPIIGFPKGLGYHYPYYARETKMNGIGVDMHTPIETISSANSKKAYQGNLDPLLLVGNLSDMKHEVARLKTAMREKRFIFNLGHGMVPETPIEHVTALCTMLKESA